MDELARSRLTIEAFESGDVDADSFDHEAHVYIAWLYLERFELSEAIGRFTTALRRLTIKLGAEGKYHATVSWFYLLLIAERRRHSSDGDWQRFCRDNADLFETGSGLLDRYYTPATLRSAAARSDFVLPDRIAV